MESHNEAWPDGTPKRITGKERRARERNTSRKPQTRAYWRYDAKELIVLGPILTVISFIVMTGNQATYTACQNAYVIVLSGQQCQHADTLHSLGIAGIFGGIVMLIVGVIMTRRQNEKRNTS